MKVSVIIPSLYSPFIETVLEHLARQSAWNDIGEILIVGKDLAGQELNDGKVRYIDTGVPVSASRARNIGIHQARYDLLYFLDSDCLPQPDCLEQHLLAHGAGHELVGGGVMARGENYWSLTYNLALFHEFISGRAPGCRDYLPALNLSVTREIAIIVGEFNPQLKRGQDIDWTVRARQAGFQPWCWPAATVQHQHSRSSFGAVWRDCANSGYFMRHIRLHNASALDSPWWLKMRWVIVLASPLVALLVTARIYTRHPGLLPRFGYLFPGVFMTKLAWCRGAGIGPIGLAQTDLVPPRKKELTVQLTRR